MIKQILHSAKFFILLMVFPMLATAQMVGFRLELPAGVNFSPSVMETVSQDGKQRTLWMEMITQENIQVMINLTNENGELVPMPFYVANNGSTDLAKVQIMEKGRGSFQVYNRGRLKQYLLPRRTHFSAWVGIPITPGLTTVIEYH